MGMSWRMHKGVSGRGRGASDDRWSFQLGGLDLSRLEEGWLAAPVPVGPGSFHGQYNLLALSWLGLAPAGHAPLPHPALDPGRVPLHLNRGEEEHVGIPEFS